MPDVVGLRRRFDYAVPERLRQHVRVGTLVRVPLHGRRVRGWVVEVADRAETDRPLLPLARITGWGPPADVVALAEWAAWRWAGHPTHFLGTASPPLAVLGLPPLRSTTAPLRTAGDRPALVREAFERRLSAVRLAPTDDPFPYVLAAAERGNALVLVPALAEAAGVARRLREAGRDVAVAPRDWARAAAGGSVVVGARAAAWAPVPELAAVLVVDEHDEVYQEERSPTWNARDVAAERARRAGVPCVLLSPCLSLETLSRAEVLVPSRAEERAGWPLLEVVDRRTEPPGRGLYSGRLVDALRQADPSAPTVCVLNRKGRARLLACAACGELARCDLCEGPLESADDGLRCRRCGAVQPAVCRTCGAARMKVLRIGVSRAREELEALAGRPVAEVTGDDPGRAPPTPVVVGTEAVLHRLDRAGVVAFLDFDQELMAPRYRAGEEALALLVRAGRLVGGRGDAGSGRLLVQTRLPDHEVLDAARHADPGRMAVVEGARRAALRLPPETALARVSGEAAGAFVAEVGRQPEVEITGPAGDRWLVRAYDHRRLCDALAATPRPPGRLRVEVDPLRA